MITFGRYYEIGVDNNFILQYNERIRYLDAILELTTIARKKMMIPNDEICVAIPGMFDKNQISAYSYIDQYHPKIKCVLNRNSLANELNMNMVLHWYFDPIVNDELYYALAVEENWSNHIQQLFICEQRVSRLVNIDGMWYTRKFSRFNIHNPCECPYT